MSKSDKRFWSDFRRFFLRGLATMLPTILTIVLLVKCYEFIQDNISVHITQSVTWIVVEATKNNPHWKNYPKCDKNDLKEYIKREKPGLDPENPKNLLKIEENPEEINKIRLWKLRQQWGHGFGSIIGFILAVILVYIVGRLLASYLGGKLWKLFERTVQQVPGFKQVYPYVKQVTDFLFGEHKIEFSRVVLVQYPRKGIWSLGLVTGAGFKYIGETQKQEFLTIFIPSSPTPVTGYVIHVQKDEVVDMPISIEEALRFTVSGGVIVPDHQILPTQQIELSSSAIVKHEDKDKE